MIAGYIITQVNRGKVDEYTGMMEFVRKVVFAGGIKR